MIVINNRRIGIKLNLGSGAHPLVGFENLDLPGWKWKYGLRYPLASIDAITVSHALMYCPKELWAFVFSQMYRALRIGGIVRITEDATDDPESSRFGGYSDAIALTSAPSVCSGLRSAGFCIAKQMEPEETMYSDYSLIQQWHGAPPKVFFVEGIK